MLTQFGKELRHLRLDRDEKLKDMAGKLGVTTAYLSAVENGNRNIPDSWIEIIADEYQLDENEICRLEKLAYDGKPEITLNIGTASVGQRNLAYSFARKFHYIIKKWPCNIPLCKCATFSLSIFN